ncbi:MAG: exonuclease domain-containing protein [Paeniclostridium sp.]
MIFNNKTVSNAKCPFEIIQIGAIKLDSELNILDTFSSYIKSEIYKDIHPFVKKMTGITNSNLKNAPSFKEVYEDFLKFIGIKIHIWNLGNKRLKRTSQKYTFIIYP